MQEKKQEVKQEETPSIEKKDEQKPARFLSSWQIGGLVCGGIALLGACLVTRPLERIYLAQYNKTHPATDQARPETDGSYTYSPVPTNTDLFDPNAVRSSTTTQPVVTPNEFTAQEPATEDLGPMSPMNFPIRLLNACLSETGGNCIVSPYTVQMETAILEPAATDMYVQRDLENITGGTESMHTKYWSDAADSHVIISNSLWVDSNIGTDDASAYWNILDQLGVERFNVDTRSAAAMEQVNDHVYNQTDGLIYPLFDAPPLTDALPLTTLIVESAWEIPFTGVTQGQFNGTTIDTMMVAASEYKMATDKGMMTICIPCDGNLTLNIVFSADGLDTKSLWDSFSEEDRLRILYRAPDEYESVLAHLYVPRFSVAAKQDVAVFFSSLKLSSLTSPGSFPGISQGACIGKLLQGVCIQCDENGILTAAPSSVSDPGQSINTEYQAIDVKVDHSFLYFLTNDLDKTVYLAGYVENVGY